MLNTGDKIVVGVSGGPDSVALVNVLSELSSSLELKLIVAHVNHNLRPTALSERDFVADLASRLSLDFFCLDADIRAQAREWRLSIEEAGRRIRYSYFEAVLKQTMADKIATAHHVDDQIETFFLRAIRGTTLTGLRGIPQARGHIIRPLIRLERSQILSYLKDRQIQYITDETNLESNTDRNFVRNVILPNVEVRFPNYRKSVLRTIEMVDRDEDLLDQMSDELYRSAVTRPTDEMVIDIKQLKNLPHSMSSRVIRAALYEMSGPNIRLGAINIDQAIRLLNDTNPSSGADLPGGLKLRRDYGRLIVSKGPGKDVHSYLYTVDGPCDLCITQTGATLRFHVREAWDNLKFPEHDRNVAYFDFDLLSFPLEIRSAVKGDRLEPWGMEGSTKVKKIFIDKKISARKRSKVPLIVKENIILWIAGLRRSRFFPLSASTSRVLEIRLLSPLDNERSDEFI